MKDEDGEMNLLRRYVAEAAAWCQSRAHVSDPRWSLRDNLLRPPSLSSVEFGPKPEEERLAMVRALAEGRAYLLSRWPQHVPPVVDVAVGRLLLFAPDQTVSDGASEVESHGFFDVYDEPAWDTWVWFAGDYLLCWIPATFVELVDAGIAANPVACIQWAADIDNDLTRRLRTVGLL